MKKNNVSCGTLFTIFFKLGLFTFGGGYVIVPLMHNEMVEKRKWITDDDIMDILVIAESTPGPISINAATFIGYKMGGFWGAAAATFGLVLPSLIVISLLAIVYSTFSELTMVNRAFRGIMAAVTILVGGATFKLGKKMKRSIFNFIILGAALVASLFFKVNAIYIILGGAFLGILYYTFLAKGEIK